MSRIFNLLNQKLSRYKIFFDIYVKPLFRIENLNILFFYSYLIIIILGALLILIGIIYSRKTKRIRKNKTKFTPDDIHHLINKIKPLRKLVDLISNPLALINFKSKAYNDVVALVFLGVYTVFIYFTLPYINKFAFMWYTQLINYLIVLLLPVALVNLYLGIARGGVDKVLPEAFSEIFSSYRNNKKLNLAIEEAIEYMSKRAKKEFTILLPYLQSEQTFEYGLDLFEKRLNNSLATLFCQIVRSSKFKNSDISKQLENLAVKSRGKQYLREKARRQLVWYEIFIIAWLFSIPLIMDFVLKISSEAYKFYFSVQGGILLTTTIIVCLASIVSIHFLQKI